MIYAPDIIVRGFIWGSNCLKIVQVLGSINHEFLVKVKNLKSIATSNPKEINSHQYSNKGVVFHFLCTHQSIVPRTVNWSHSYTGPVAINYSRRIVSHSLILLLVASQTETKSPVSGAQSHAQSNCDPRSGRGLIQVRSSCPDHCPGY